MSLVNQVMGVERFITFLEFLCSSEWNEKLGTQFIQCILNDKTIGIIAVTNKTMLQEARKKIMDELDDVPEFKFTTDGEKTFNAKQENLVENNNQWAFP